MSSPNAKYIAYTFIPGVVIGARGMLTLNKTYSRAAFFAEDNIVRWKGRKGK